MFNQRITHFCSQLNIRLPIIQAPMAGGIVTPALIRETIKNGGLGSLPLGYLSVEEAESAIRKIKLGTPSTFAVNIFIPASAINPTEKQLKKMFRYINKYRKLIGLPILSEITPSIEPEIDELLEMIINEGVAIVSFTFGLLSKSAMTRLREKNIFVMGTATTVQEGLALQAIGCHAVIAQGYEAGGHRGGGFLKEQPEGLVGTIALIPQMVDALDIPVIASGGIMDGRGIAAALMLGASAVQMGTAFLTCEESNASPLHKRMILDNTSEDTCITSVFTGKSVRSFKNEFISEAEKNFKQEEIPAYPIQHQITKELRKKANVLNYPECAGLWSGQGVQLSRQMSVKRLMSALEKETISTISQFNL